MIRIRINFTKEFIDHAILNDRCLFTFKPPYTPAPDEVDFDSMVSGWALRVVGFGNDHRLVATPTNRRTGGILRAGKRNAIRERFPDVPDQLIDRYIKLSRGKPYVWELEVQHNYFYTMLDMPDKLIELRPSRVNTLHGLLA